MESILVTHRLTKKFGDFYAVRDLDLDVWRGEIFGFLGPNGAGKSTTIRMLLGLIRPSSGSAEMFGMNVRKHGTKVKRRIGYMPGELALYENLTPMQYFEYTASLYGIDDLTHARELAERLRITSLDTNIGDLSQGNKQKVGLVQALLHRPELVILDEPTNGLDPLVRHELYDLLVDARDHGATIFFSSHVLAEAEDVCDRVALIREGELARVGTIEELKSIAPRKVRICFEQGVPIETFDSLPGVSAMYSEGRETVDLVVRRNMDDVVKIAARYPVSDMYSSAVSLEEIFMAYYEPQDGNGHAHRTGNDVRPELEEEIMDELEHEADLHDGTRHDSELQEQHVR